MMSIWLTPFLAQSSLCDIAQNPSFARCTISLLTFVLCPHVTVKVNLSKSQLALNGNFVIFTGMVKVPSGRLIDFTRSASLDESDLRSLTLWSNASIHITENPISESVVC